MTTLEVMESARRLKQTAALMSHEQKTSALINMAAAIDDDLEVILRANSVDLNDSRSIMSDVTLDRLALNDKKVAEMAENLRLLARLPDPVGAELEAKTLPNGLNIHKVAVPIGVIAVICENRPRVAADAAGLAIKSGNVCILKIGKEAFGTSRAIVNAMRKGLKKAGVSQNIIGLIEDSSRESDIELMTAVDYVDLLIPRGGKLLIQTCIENAKVPCILTGTGICHVYVDSFADIEKALNIIENAKCSRPAVCNAMEVCLVSKEIAGKFLPALYERLVSERNINKVVLRLDDVAYGVLGERENCFPAFDSDYDTEFLDYVMAVKVVDGVKEAVQHISAHSSGHSDCIITENAGNAKLFTRAVDSAAVYVNASTRFTDGGEFGLGCELGISTQKLHARGPIGLKDITSYKYVICGDGHTR